MEERKKRAVACQVKYLSVALQYLASASRTMWHPLKKGAYLFICKLVDGYSFINLANNVNR